MWVFTRDGFFSIVVHRDNPDHLLVRAREGDDLRRAFPDAEVIDLPDSDYRFRTTVPRDTVHTYLRDSLDLIDYDTNVKGTLDRGEMDRKRFMGDVWSAGFWFQEGREYPDNRRGDYSRSSRRWEGDIDG